MDIKRYKNEMIVDELKNVEILENFNEFDLQDLCYLMKEPIRSVHSCISKGQLQTLCKQLIVENIALKSKLKKAQEQSHD